MAAGDEQDPVGTRDRLGLVAGPGLRGVVAEEDRRIGPVGVAGPQAVELGGVAVHVIPARVDDPAVVQTDGMPLVGFVKRQRPDVPAVGVHAVQRVDQFRAAAAAAELAAAPRGHERDAAVGKRTGIEIVVRAVGELAQPRAVGIHRQDVKGVVLRLRARRAPSRSPAACKGPCPSGSAKAK